MGKVKFSDLIGNKEVLKAEELAVVTGGTCGDGCNTGVCNSNVKYGAEQYCCNAVCTSGVGVCNENTNGSVQVNPPFTGTGNTFVAENYLSTVVQSKALLQNGLANMVSI